MVKDLEAYQNDTILRREAGGVDGRDPHPGLFATIIDREMYVDGLATGIYSHSNEHPEYARMCDQIAELKDRLGLLDHPTLPPM